MARTTADIAQHARLSEMVVAAADRARANFADAVKHIGLPPHLARTLLFLHEPRAMRSVANELVCDPSHVTGIADDLEARGLATRTPGTDRRIKLLSLTPKGEAVRRQVVAAVDDHTGFVDMLDESQRKTLAELLTLILED